MTKITHEMIEGFYDEQRRLKMAVKQLLRDKGLIEPDDSSFITVTWGIWGGDEDATVFDVELIRWKPGWPVDKEVRSKHRFYVSELLNRTVC